MKAIMVNVIVMVEQRFFRLAKPMFLLFDVCNNDSYVMSGLRLKSSFLKIKA